MKSAEGAKLIHILRHFLWVYPWTNQEQSVDLSQLIYNCISVEKDLRIETSWI